MKPIRLSEAEQKIDFDNLENSWMDLDEFVCLKDTFIARTLPQNTKKETESGLILSTQADSVVNDRPDAGVVVSVGPEAEFRVGEYIFIQKGHGYDLANIRKDPKADYNYLLLYTDAVIGKKSPKE